jgi:hypothetical protein
MESLTKNKMNEQIINAMAKKAFGEFAAIQSIQELNQGYYNATYHIVLRDGFQCFLKIAPSPKVRVLRYEKNIMNVEVQALSLVSSHTAVPVPKILFYDDSKELCDSNYLCLEWINGTSYNSYKPDNAPKHKPMIDYMIGKYNKAINSIQNKSFGYFGQPLLQESNWELAFFRMMNDIMDDGREAEIILPCSYDYISELLILFPNKVIDKRAKMC